MILKESLLCYEFDLELFSLSGSLWVAWTRHYLLRYNSLWDVKEGTRGSWIWYKLFKISDHVSQFIKFDIREGRTSHFNFDDWLNMGWLVTITGDVGTRISDEMQWWGQQRRKHAGKLGLLKEDIFQILLLRFR